MSELSQQPFYELGRLHDSLLAMSQATTPIALFEQLTSTLHLLTEQQPIVLYRHVGDDALRLVYCFPARRSHHNYPHLYRVSSSDMLANTHLQYYELKGETGTWGYIGHPPLNCALHTRWASLIIEIASQRLRILKVEQLAKRRADLKRSRSLLYKDIHRCSSIKHILQYHGERLCHIFESQGIALIRHNTLSGFGHHPPEQHIVDALVLAQKDASANEAVALKGKCHGGLASKLNITSAERGWLCLFRQNPLQPPLHIGLSHSVHQNYWLPMEAAMVKELADDLTMMIAAMDATCLNQQLAKSNERLQRLAHTDPLTKCWNRYYTEVMLSNLIDSNASIAIMLFDIDNFKNINDTYGHTVGDDILRELTRVVQTTLRHEDHLGRWGGEEFIVITNTTDFSTNMKLAKRLCDIVSTSFFNIPFPVTISVGLAFKQPGDQLRLLLERADRCMYLAKMAGKNQVVTSEI